MVRLLVAPSGVVTLIGPFFAPIGTVAIIELSELAEKVVAFTPLKLIAVAPVKFAPLIVTCVPAAPKAGLNPIMVGALAAITMKVLG